MTRKDYLNGRVTHRQYYASICAAAGIKFESTNSLVLRAATSRDPYYNDIALKTWNVFAAQAKSALSKAFKEHEDFYSLAGGVCAIKEAVRQAVESANAEAQKAAQ